MTDNNLLEEAPIIPTHTSRAKPATQLASKLVDSFLSIPIKSCRVKVELTEFSADEIYDSLTQIKRRKGNRDVFRVHRSADTIYLIKEEPKVNW